MCVYFVFVCGGEESVEHTLTLGDISKQFYGNVQCLFIDGMTSGVRVPTDLQVPL